ncbi:hypothetical protein SAMN06297144_2645 [Sphingomonas guangdongensis]|uniref:Lipoprotein n=1 Tax=Sphingomonas guangdongensis TaxID=1141890 RepID=A0A285R061_9SPHN|nr:hypothetical protein [Sphingomonas guangdongensis]SOB87513.1 hypothetical protein SAMN06297144_2645 [Sphingomonas guangdongensis]
MRISSALLLLIALVGCDGAPEDSGFPGTNAAAPAPERIACARGEGPLAEQCLVERSPAPGGGELLVIHHGDGGFRRLRQAGATVESLDGAVAPTVEMRDSGLDVQVGQDRYRLPTAR